MSKTPAELDGDVQDVKAYVESVFSEIRKQLNEGELKVSGAN
jgi:hypothetical protein